MLQISWGVSVDDFEGLKSKTSQTGQVQRSSTCSQNKVFI